MADNKSIFEEIMGFSPASSTPSVDTKAPQGMSREDDIFTEIMGFEPVKSTPVDIPEPVVQKPEVEQPEPVTTEPIVKQEVPSPEIKSDIPINIPKLSEDPEVAKLESQFYQGQDPEIKARALRSFPEYKGSELLKSLPDDEQVKIRGELEKLYNEDRKGNAFALGILNSTPIPTFFPKEAKEEIQKTQEAAPVASAAGQITGTIGQAILGGQVIGGALGKLKPIANSPLLRNALTRLTTAGVIAAEQNIGRKEFGEAMQDVAQQSGGGLLSIVPEIIAPPGVAQVIAQPLTDLIYDVATDKIRGKDVGSKEWWKNEIISLASSAGFAIKDAASGKTFEVEQAAQREELKNFLGKNKDADIEIIESGVPVGRTYGEVSNEADVRDKYIEDIQQKQESDLKELYQGEEYIPVRPESQKQKRETVESGMYEKTLTDQINEEFTEKPTKKQIVEKYGVSREDAGKAIDASKFAEEEPVTEAIERQSPNPVYGTEKDIAKGDEFEKKIGGVKFQGVTPGVEFKGEVKKKPLLEFKDELSGDNVTVEVDEPIGNLFKKIGQARKKREEYQIPKKEVSDGMQGKTEAKIKTEAPVEPAGRESVKEIKATPVSEKQEVVTKQISLPKSEVKGEPTSKGDTAARASTGKAAASEVPVKKEVQTQKRKEVTDGKEKQVQPKLETRTESRRGRGSKRRRPATVKRRAKTEEYEPEYWKSQHSHHLNVELYNSLKDGWTDRSGKDRPGKYKGWVDDYNILTDSKAPGGSKNPTLSQTAKDWMQDIVDNINENPDYVQELKNLGIKKPEHIDDVQEMLQSSMSASGFVKYHNEYEKGKRTTTGDEDAFNEAVRVFNEEPYNLTSDQKKILEGNWGMSVDDAVKLENEQDVSFDFGANVKEEPKPKKEMKGKDWKQQDLFGKEKSVSEMEQDAKKKAEKAEIKRRTEETKGGEADLKNLPMFEDQDIEGSQQTIKFENEVKKDVGAIPREDSEVKKEVSKIDVNPSEAQKEVGNYQKGHIKRDGMEISLENAAGSRRSGTDPTGKKWSQKINHDYGYIRGTKGADAFRDKNSSDQVDVFIKPNSEEGGTVYVINQNDPSSGKFDEHKVMIGFDSKEEAESAYLSNYQKGWKGLESTVEMSMDDFKKWVKTDATKRPAKKQDSPEMFKQEEMQEGLGEQGSIRIGNKGDALKDIVETVKRTFRSRGGLPTDVFRSKLKKDRWLNAELKEVENTTNEFKSIAKKVYGKDRISSEDAFKIDQVFKGESPYSDIDKRLHDVVKRMRMHTDALSQKMIDEGVVDGDLALTVENNLGLYANRAYRVHKFGKKWKEKVPEEIVNRATSYIRKEYPDLTEDQVKGKINDLLNSQESPLEVLAKEGKLGARKLGITKARKGIPEEIRALWGEYKNADVNYVNSVTKMANLISSHRFLNEVKESGTGRFLFEEPEVNKSGDFSYKIAADESSTMEPLNGLYTSKEIKEAFENVGLGKINSEWLKKLIAASSTAKYAKTVLSPITHIRNLIGNTGFAIANGHIDVTKAPSAIKSTFDDFIGKDPVEKKKYLRDLRELGIIGTGARYGEIEGIIKDVDQDQFDIMFGTGKRRAVRSAIQKATKLYSAEDDVWKIYAFENEYKRYKKAFPEMDEKELKQKVSDIVLNTYPTYDLIPKFVQRLRRLPLIGSFVSFPAEVIRTAGNTIKIASQEIRDPATRNIGYQRIAGMITAATITGAAVEASKFMTGNDREKDRAKRSFMGPWSKFTQILYTGKDKNGNDRYVDLGYTDPHSYLKEPVVALISGKNWEEKLIGAASSLASPFISDDLFTQKLFDLKRNKKPDGQPIWNESDSFENKLAKGTEHVWSAIEPGIVTGSKRIFGALSGKEGSFGQRYDAKTELASQLTGIRVSKADIKRSLMFHTFRYNRDVRNASRLIQQHSGGMSGEEKKKIAYSLNIKNKEGRESFYKKHGIGKKKVDAFNLWSKQQMKIDDKFRDIIKDALISGENPISVYQVLKSSGMGAEKINTILGTVVESGNK